MGGKEHLGMGTVFVDILYNRPCDGDTIVGRGAASELIEEHERALAEVVEDSRCFVHLYHKRRFAYGYIIRSAHSGEDLIHDTDAG